MADYSITGDTKLDTSGFTKGVSSMTVAAGNLISDLTKTAAKKLGWVSGKDNLGEVAPGRAIGGSQFENREGRLPAQKGRTYFECDVNVVDGHRSSARLVYSNDGLIYYTEDGYRTFTCMYGGK